MIKAVIFDYAGVIVTEAGTVWLRETLSDYEAKKTFLQVLSDKLDKADITSKEFTTVWQK